MFFTGRMPFLPPNQEGHPAILGPAAVKIHSTRDLVKILT